MIREVGHIMHWEKLKELRYFCISISEDDIGQITLIIRLSFTHTPCDQLTCFLMVSPSNESAFVKQNMMFSVQIDQKNRRVVQQFAQRGCETPILGNITSAMSFKQDAELDDLHRSFPI